MATPPQPIQPVAPKPLSTDELLSLAPREFLLLVGKDGAGKSSAIVALARFVELVLNPEAAFFVIDTENKFPTALRSFGTEAPRNIRYFKCDTMNDATDAIDVVMAQRKPGDWLAVESMSRLWERAQNMGYLATSGYDKAKYLEIRREKVKSAPVIPSPDRFWDIVKGAHDGAFLDLISQSSSLNAVLSSTLAKPPKESGFGKENDTRKAVRTEFGLDLGVDGAPRLPYYVETLLYMDIQGDKGRVRVMRDNNSVLADTRVEFMVAGKTMFAQEFWLKCR